MYQPKLEKDIRCPLEYGLDVFGGKWKSRILCVLAVQGVLRYSDIRREMVNIADPVLSAALKELMADELVERQAYAEIPLRVEYRLTERGRSVVPILQSICRWAGQFYHEPSDAAMTQCRRCDYRGAGGVTA